MGAARLLAKGWVVFCLFAGAHGLFLALTRGQDIQSAARFAGLCVLLFGAMGLLFAGGFGVAEIGISSLSISRLRRSYWPSFDGLVFCAFVGLILLVQTVLVHEIGGTPAGQALLGSVHFVVPGERALIRRLSACGYDDAHIYSIALASAVAWLLAFVFVAASASRIALAAGIVRLERMRFPSSFGPTLLAALYGMVAVIGIQLLFVGSAYNFLGCGMLTGITGAALSGLAPLTLAYLIFAALVMLKASGPAD
ncbi:MAG: hypothetical protein JSR60_07955 [Proteobacteria bacterium]|nr:hypothetical protein [Pseudomonadota bacterium]